MIGAICPRSVLDVRGARPPAASPLRLLLLLAAILIPVSGCRYPQDPHRTLARVEGKQLLVGVADGGGTLTARERAAIDRLARSVRARVRIVGGEPHRLFARLADGRIHLVAGGIPDDTPWRSKAALSDPLGSIELGGDRRRSVLAVRRGENAWLMAVDKAIAASRRTR